jgi:hypothetical protein
VAWWSSAAANWRKFRELSPREGRLLLQAFLVLPLMGLGLRYLGWGRLHARLAQGQLPAQKPGPEELMPRAQVTARMVQAAARYGFCRPNCLPQSLTLWWLLRRQGIRSDLRIGVNPKGGGLEAHAWVECQGWVLNDHDQVHRQFVPFHQAIIPGGDS